MKTKSYALFLSFLLLVSACSGSQGLTNKAKGGMIGGGSGAALGAIIGGIAGKGKGAAIGAAVGTVVGGGTGVLIGNKLDKAKKAAEAANAQAEILTDSNTGLQYLKATFSSGLLFSTGSAALSATAQNSIAQFCKGVDPDLNFAVYGFTDNVPFKGVSAAESKRKNINLSQQRAESVKTALLANGVANARIVHVQGYGEENPVADNSTKTGQEQNRRVEVYIIPSQETLNNANAQAK